MNRHSVKSEGEGCVQAVDSESAQSADRFKEWEYPEIEEGKPTKYNWVVQHKDNLKLGYKTDIGAFSFVNSNIPNNVVAVGVPARVIKSISS
jgi:hypothetical protein